MENEIEKIEAKNENEIFIIKENDKYNMKVELTLIDGVDINSQIIHTLSNQYIRRMTNEAQWNFSD